MYHFYKEKFMYCANCHYLNHHNHVNPYLSSTYFRAVPEDELFSDGETDENLPIEQPSENPSPTSSDNENIDNIPETDTNSYEDNMNNEIPMQDDNFMQDQDQYENESYDFMENNYEKAQNVFNPYEYYNYNNYNYYNGEDFEYSDLNEFTDDRYDEDFNNEYDEEFDFDDLRKCQYAYPMWNTGFQFEELLPPKAPAPNYIPDKLTALNAKSEINALKACQSKWTFLSLKDGNAFWMFMIYVGSNCIAGFRQKGCCIENYYFAININDIDGFFM